MLKLREDCTLKETGILIRNGQTEGETIQEIEWKRISISLERRGKWRAYEELEASSFHVLKRGFIYKEGRSWASISLLLLPFLLHLSHPIWAWFEGEWWDRVWDSPWKRPPCIVISLSLSLSSCASLGKAKARNTWKALRKQEKERGKKKRSCIWKFWSVDKKREQREVDAFSFPLFFFSFSLIYYYWIKDEPGWQFQSSEMADMSSKFSSDEFIVSILSQFLK